MIDLSIIIVSYNTKEVLLDCLRSVHAHTTAIFDEAPENVGVPAASFELIARRGEGLS